MARQLPYLKINKETKHGRLMYLTLTTKKPIRKQEEMVTVGCIKDKHVKYDWHNEY